VVEPSTADTLLIVGTVPVLYVVTDDEADELGEVHANPDSALNTKVYGAPEVNPVIVIGLAVPDASVNDDPPLVEYWYFVNAG
jgi:hypothetical protein